MEEDPRELATKAPLDPLDPDAGPAEVAVQVSQDGMAAFLTVSLPASQWTPLTVGDLLDRLAEAQVSYGIARDAVEGVLRAVSTASPALVGPFQVAWGIPAVNGEDARIEYHESLMATSGRPRVLEDGRVNLFDLNTVHNVPKGTVLAVLTPPTPGEPGMTVLGAKVWARPGRDLWLRTGRGVVVSEDRRTATSEIDGHATLMEGKIEVTSILVISKDIGVETGNIQFLGSVVIHGNVLSGFCVQADGDVEINGSVEGGTVVAQGNVTVLYGIKGGNRGTVVAGGAVKARFIEGAEVQAGTCVWAADGILQSRIEAGEGVEVLGKRGAIIGGSLLARDSVSARFLGSAMGCSTEITVGVAPRLRQELLDRRQKLGEMQVRLQRMDQTLRYLSDHERKGLLSIDKREMTARLVQLQEQLYNDMEGLRSRCKELERAMGDVHLAWVQAEHTCYPGVRVGIGPALLTVTSQLLGTRFHVGDQREIVYGPIPHPSSSATPRGQV